MATPLSSLRKAARTDQIVVLAALALVVVGCFFVLKPFLSALLWAVILTFSSWPAFRVLLGWVRGRRTLAAFLMTFAIALVLLVPSVVIVLTLAGDVREFAATTVAWVRQGPPSPPEWLARVPWVGEELIAMWKEYAADSKQLLVAAEQFIDPLTSWLLAIGTALGRGVLELSLSMFLAFFFFLSRGSGENRPGLWQRQNPGNPTHPGGTPSVTWGVTHTPCGGLRPNRPGPWYRTASPDHGLPTPREAPDIPHGEGINALRWGQQPPIPRPGAGSNRQPGSLGRPASPTPGATLPKPP